MPMLTVMLVATASPLPLQPLPSLPCEPLASEASAILPEACPPGLPDASAHLVAPAGTQSIGALNAPLRLDPALTTPVQAAQEASGQGNATTGDAIVVEGSPKPPKDDPLERLNYRSYQAVQAVDDAVVAPLAKGYEHGLPAPARDGLHNFFRNLREPVIFVNFLLQGKPGKAAETLGRFAINSTVGVAGLVDMAKRKPFKMPFRKNGFADTLGYYGVKPGPYLVLPLIGPTTVRDLIGTGLDTMVVPNIAGKLFRSPAYSVGSYTIHALDKREAINEKLRRIRASSDPYATMRETYLCNRRAEIAGLHNRPQPDCMPADPGAPAS